MVAPAKAGLVLKPIVAFVPLQISCTAGVGFATGTGFTVIETVSVDDAQPLAVAVIVKTVVSGVLVVFVNTPDIEVPFPSGIPVILLVLFLVQLCQKLLSEHLQKLLLG